MLFGFAVAIFTAVAIRMTEGFDSKSIDLLAQYVSELNGSMEIFSSEAGILFFLYQVSEYSHWIFTGCIIWIVVILYFLTRKVEKNEKI